MREQIAYAIIIFTCTGLLGLLGKGLYNGVCKFKRKREQHERDHMQLIEYPALFKQHEEAHKDIKNSLLLSFESNLTQHRAQLMSIYDTAKAQGYITMHWYYQFCEQFELYHVKMNGNGPVVKMMEEIHAMDKL